MQLAIQHAIQFLNNDLHFSSSGAISEAKEIVEKLKPKKEGNKVFELHGFSESGNISSNGKPEFYIMVRCGDVIIVSQHSTPKEILCQQFYLTSDEFDELI